MKLVKLSLVTALAAGAFGGVASATPCKRSSKMSILPVLSDIDTTTTPPNGLASKTKNTQASTSTASLLR